MNLLNAKKLSVIEAGYTIYYPENYSELLLKTGIEVSLNLPIELMKIKCLAATLKPNSIFISLPYIVVKNLYRYYFFRPKHSSKDSIQ
jgi:hypothetical protein